MNKRSLEDINKQFKSLLKTDDVLFLENSLKNRSKKPISTINSIYKRFDIYKILVGCERGTDFSEFYIKGAENVKYLSFLPRPFNTFPSRFLHHPNRRYIYNIDIDIFFSTPEMTEDIFEKYIAENSVLFNMKRYDKNDEILSIYNKMLNKELHHILIRWDIKVHILYKNRIESFYMYNQFTFSGPKQKSMYEIDITKGIIHKK